MKIGLLQAVPVQELCLFTFFIAHHIDGQDIKCVESETVTVIDETFEKVIRVIIRSSIMCQKLIDDVHEDVYVVEVVYFVCIFIVQFKIEQLSHERLLN